VAGPRRNGWAPAVAVLAAGFLVTGLVWRQNRWEVGGAARHAPGTTSPAVPALVRSAVLCLQRLDARTFRVAGHLAADYQQYQPLVVAAWPIQVDERSPLVVVAAWEVATLPCRAEVRCHGEGVTVAACPP
jgi:hypothetical protein